MIIYHFPPKNNDDLKNGSINFILEARSKIGRIFTEADECQSTTQFFLSSP